MSERIRELWMTTDTEHHNPPALEWAEKFAELIVQECVSILLKPRAAMEGLVELSEYNRGWVNGRLIGIEQIKDHFGIEQ